MSMNALCSTLNGRDLMKFVLVPTANLFVKQPSNTTRNVKRNLKKHRNRQTSEDNTSKLRYADLGSFRHIR